MKKRAIITSALPYANGEIHLGHVASTYLPADVTVRFLRLKGAEAYYVCASDDYGTPILIQSERENKSPTDYVRHWNERDAQDFAALGIGFDLFYRTSSPENTEFVQRAFSKLYEGGHIYESEVVQAYCENDAKFLPDRYVKGRCPYCKAEDQYSDLCEKCGRVPESMEDPRCSICGQAPVQKKSAHYFFRLSAFSEQLSKWLATSQNLQPDVKKYVQNWISSGLKDWDITRDIPWGVPVPLDGASGKVFYGWFDNHLAYISTAIKMLEERGISGKEFWNSADIYHFIGKDIVYHHYLFLPAMRMGLGQEYKLPDYMPTRGHLTLQAKKISKSRNWYIGLRDFLDLYPADYLRFYLLSISPYSQDDLNFDWDDFEARVNSELIGNVGNLVNRALGFAKRAYGGQVPEPGAETEADAEAQRQIGALAADLDGLLSANHLDRGLRRILGFAAHFNQYFQHAEPWKGGPGAPACVYYSVNAVRSIAVALCPFLPESAGRMWAQLGLEGSPEGQGWESVSQVSIAAGHVIGDPAPLFARVERSDIESHKARLGGSHA